MIWQIKNQSPTLDGETELFLKTAGGGLVYFKAYLGETQEWTADRPIADLNPDMFHWMAIQAYLAERQDEALMVQLARHLLFYRHDRTAKADSRLPLSVRSIQQVIKQLSEQTDIARRFNRSPHSLRRYFFKLSKRRGIEVMYG